MQGLLHSPVNTTAEAVQETGGEHAFMLQPPEDDRV